jgi:hypothetical protein
MLPFVVVIADRGALPKTSENGSRMEVTGTCHDQG